MDLRTRKLMNRLGHAAVTAVITTVLLFILFMWITNDDASIDGEDDFTVIVEYDCRDVLLTPSDFPLDAVVECRNKFRVVDQPRARPST